ncbi:Ser-Thr-rich glycosyl-phosphatidyl-inositol-anchored membrane family-domain-containing protein [Cadophora sp. MPI-SDFR-AT-0126]|nr:Ser-Thr-rich glycosyl-phosphatidyl-inositol-anchored membrane family-domain-containing protein [Leotiomycetes sp. MPI-SDFR-AT-0126]
MQYSFVAAAVLAFTSSVFAQTAGFAAITVPTQDQNVEAGSVLDITWQPSTEHTGPITIQLLQGASPSTLEIGETIAESIDQTTGKFAWTVPKDLKSFATYGFKLTLDSTKSDPSPIFQFSFPFHVTGLGSSSSSSTSATGGTTTVHISTGPSYTAKPTSSSYSASSASVNSTSTYVPSSYSAPASSGSVVYPTANVTLSTTLTPTTAPTGTGSSPSSTGSSPSTVTGNSASTIARGGFAVAAGMVLAFAL